MKTFFYECKYSNALFLLIFNQCVIDEREMTKFDEKVYNLKSCVPECVPVEEFKLLKIIEPKSHSFNVK